MTSAFARLSIAALVTSLMWTTANAQNGSLLYAPMPGQTTTMRSGQANAPPQVRFVGQVTNQQAYRDQAYRESQQQSSSDRPPIQLDETSWTYQPPPPLRVFDVNDVVTIRVDEISRTMAEGAAESRKRTLYEAILTDWIRLQDLRLRPDPQENGDPTIAAESNKNYRAESTIESRESLTFNIAATVVDIRPNGNLVLEASKSIRLNDNLWETALTGICRAQDIAPDNVVLSKDLIDLQIRKVDRGHLRDGYKRGWLQRILDRVQFF